MIRIIDKIDILQEIKIDWDRLLSISSDSTPFQSHEFITSSWNVMNSKECSLYVMMYTCDRDKELQAIFPFYIDRKGILRFINDRHSDFCDAIILNSVRQDYHLWEEVTTCILSRSDVKKICLRNIRSGSVVGPYFRYFFQTSSEYAENAYSTLIVNPCTSGEHFSSNLQFLTGREKQKLRQISKKITNLTFKVFDVSTDEAKDVLNSLVKEMSESGTRRNSYINQLMPIVLDLLAHELASIFVTYCDGNAVALKVFLHEKKSKEYISWLMFYVDKKYNQYNIIQSIEYIANSGGIYNFARGVYGYKMEKFRPQIHNLYTLRWSRSLIGQIGDLFAMNLYHIKQIVKKIIRK